MRIRSYSERGIFRKAGGFWIDIQAAGKRIRGQRNYQERMGKPGSLCPNTERIWSGIYLGKDPQDGDNSDNGHFVINLDPRKVDPSIPAN